MTRMLTRFVGIVWSSSVAGGKMKSTATQPTSGGWTSPNTGATNSSGFTGLPGGTATLVAGSTIWAATGTGGVLRMLGRALPGTAP
ncbi:MAG: hypothetical protein FJ344_05660 [Sphingomonadales bacterium]|nr:hypothetical protein [Sphingomonadales bacterium]